MTSAFASPDPLCCTCGLRSHHPGLCRVAERANTLEKRLAQLQAAGLKSPHGTHARYVGGKCRCQPCRQANRDYENGRAKRLARGITNKTVSAQKAKAHILALSEAGIGYKTLADVAGVGKTIVQEVRVGHRLNIRQETERRILAVSVDARADASRVDAAPTMRLLEDLVKQGYAKAQIARWLGNKTPTIQFGKHGWIHARHELAIKKLYNRLQRQPETKSRFAFRMVDSQKTWKLIDELVGGGYTKKQLAKWLGIVCLPTRKPHVRATTEQIVEELYRKVQDGFLFRDDADPQQRSVLMMSARSTLGPAMYGGQL